MRRVPAPREVEPTEIQTNERPDYLERFEPESLEEIEADPGHKKMRLC